MYEIRYYFVTDTGNHRYGHNSVKLRLNELPNWLSKESKAGCLVIDTIEEVF